MTVPIIVLLAFAVWTLAFLITGVGIDRWSKILTRRAQLNEFPADTPHGSARYRRAMRAHANCVENLPVYGAIVVVITHFGLDLPVLDVLAVVFMAARILQSLTHVLFTETNTTVGVRFSFFFTQVICMLWMAGLAAAVVA